MDYLHLAEVYEEIVKTPKRLEKTRIIAELFRNASKEELPLIIPLLQGSVFPPSEKEMHIGISSKTAVKIIASCSGNSPAQVEVLLNREGDLGLVAEKLLSKKRQSTLFSRKLTVKKVVENIRKLPDVSGAGTVEKKSGLVAELLNMASPLEAKYVVKTVLENLRSGVGDSIVRDAIIWAFLPRVAGVNITDEESKGMKILKAEKPEDIKDTENYGAIAAPSDENAREIYNYLVETVQSAYDLSNDLARLAEILKEKGLIGLREVGIEAGNPLKVMLYVKAKDFADAFEIVGKPAIAERKFDGFRMQIHGLRNGDVRLYTRRLDDVTKQFPDVVKLVKDNVRAKNFIIDSEVVGIDPKTGRFRPFQEISQRIKRKYEIEKLAKGLPIIIEIFDAMELNNRSLLGMPFGERRKLLSASVHEVKGKIALVEQKIVKSEEELKKFYEKVLGEGVEGVMLKNMTGVYRPGVRVGFGVKIKPTMETLDLVITAAEWGEGKRATWLSSFTLACAGEDGELLEIGKVGTGIKEKSEAGVSFEQLTEELKPLIYGERKGKEVRVKPKVVVELAYQEIQKSPSYSSGYALRFPRVVRLRDEKGVADINTIKDVERLYYQQDARKKKQ
ncbi:MAG TPA: ATP-dependent DNA ligase [Nanoarchaeota archaeon]|nr:ATP-dependent DNA ligase [Nanoarchaeota archaeon]